MEKIRKHFESHTKLSDKDWQIFSSKLNRHKFPKNHLLLKAGQTERYLSFVETGIVRYFIPKADTDLTFGFVFADNFVSAYDSFLTQQPCAYHLQAMTELTLWRLAYDDLQDIYRETEIGNTIGRLASEDLFLKKSRRELSLLHETAEERYLKLFDEQPHLIQQIPLKYLASYIGITPQALSRIRRRIT
ncbi:MAG TPA: Crp/Fnr family transcriptional regulator [Cytophagaceae bacterium]|jgi:CRP-like cAMP-binding protein